MLIVFSSRVLHVNSTRDESGGMSSSITFNYALGEQSEMKYTEMLTNLRKDN